MNPLKKFRWSAALAFAACALVGAATVHASNYPSKPIKLIIPYAVGGSTDQTGRLMAKSLSERLGQAVVVENRAGAGGTLGQDFVAKASADGYTLLFSAAGPLTVTPHTYAKLSYDPVKSFEPIALVATQPLLLAVKPGLKADSVAELIAQAKANPGKLSYGSFGNGSAAHLAGEYFKTLAGVDMVHVPYRGGGPAVTALLSKDVDFTLAAPSVAAQFVDGGQLRAIARSGGDEPLKLYPKLTSFKEQGVDASYTLWSALYAPAATPADVQEKLKTTLRAIYADPAFQKAADGAGLDLKMLQGSDLKAFHESEEVATNKLIHIIGKI